MKDVIEQLGELGIKVEYITGREAYSFCPFHKETSPSFCASIDKPVWFCHSCERGGGFNQLRQLLTGSKVYHGPAFVDQSREDEKVVRQIARMSISDFYDLPSAVGCRYLNNRGVKDSTIDAWEIRRSPLFIVFPVFSGVKMVGLVLRAMVESHKPKYQNQPTKEFDRRFYLYRKPNFRDRGGILVLVEGPVDCIRVWQNAHENVCSSLGKLSREQAEVVKKHSNNVMILYDNEDSGKEATVRAAGLLRGISLEVPNYKFYHSEDPGEMEEDEFGAIMSNRISYVKSRIGGDLKFVRKK